MADNARGIHVSPGIYTREIDINYAVRSLGITTLGVVGETLKGPAFQPMDIANWREFQEVFGGTSTEKFKGSQYPKYELPYIAKSYLSESEQLKVVRVLGLSGYNAGPAWLVTASKEYKDESGNTQTSGTTAVAVIRSRGTYNPYETGSTTDCICEESKYDVLKYFVGEKPHGDDGTCNKDGYNMNALQIQPYVPMDSSGNECEGYGMTGGTTDWYISQNNHGRFKLVGVKGVYSQEEVQKIIASGSGAAGAPYTRDEAVKMGYFEYPVTLNPYDKEYILNVLGSKPYDGDAPIFVESLYDVALDQAIVEDRVNIIDNKLVEFDVKYTADYCHHEQVGGLLRMAEKALRRKHVGMRFLADAESVELGIKAVPYDYEKNKPVDTNSNTLGATEVIVGQIYTVRQYTKADGKRDYHYGYYTQGFSGAVESGVDMTNIYGNLQNGGTENNTENSSKLVLNAYDGLYYRMNEANNDVAYVEIDMNDYKSAYRYASTPWIVSNLKGDFNHVEVNKLFRFHTITDGNNANYEVKVSIENIRPDDGLFDVVVRRVDDADEQIVPLERFGRCSMIPGDSNYIAYKIGSFDGVYESKSKYITVEVNESTAAKMSVPAGFLGYPIPQYNGLPIDGERNSVAFPTLKYNRFFDPDIKNRKQYFGLSSWVGVDIDNFTFKGNKAYIDDPRFMSHGFHLDSRLDNVNGGLASSSYTVDGASGYVFDCVSTDSRTSTLPGIPLIGTEQEMYGSIYEYVNLRKFTLYFYGAFDGWDDYRDERTNKDEYKMSQYRGYINAGSGEGYAFNRPSSVESARYHI